LKKIKIIYGLEAVGGGALKHLTYLVTRLNKEHFDIVVVLSNQRKDQSEFEIEQMINSGVNVIFLPIPKRIHIIKDFWITIKIFSILRKGNFDIIHAHSSKAGGIFRVAAFILGSRNVLYTPHCFYYQGKVGFKRSIFLNIEKILAKLSSFIIVSENEKKEILKYKIIKKDRIQNINNAIDFNEYQHSIEINTTLKEFNIPKGYFIVGSIGRLTHQKDWETFVFAANEVLKKYPKTVFIITGDGELKNEIKKLIFTLGLERNIMLTGYVQEIHKILGIMDIFVSTSLWEGLSYVILEAMSYKKPVIATDTGNEYVIEHKISGFITPVKDYHTIASKISELINDKQKAMKMGKEGKNILIQKYSFEFFINRHEELYRKIVVKT